MRSWVPILSSSHAATSRAWDAVDAIVHAVAEGEYATTDRPHRGEEEALLYAYYAKARGSDDWAERAASSLNGEIGGMRNHALGLYGGLCGLGWTVEHLPFLLDDDAPSDGDDPEDDLAAELDAAVVAELQRHQPGTWSRPYDLISGLAGFGVYLAERLPRPAAAEGLTLVIDHLEALARPMNPGIAWHTRPDLIPDWQRSSFPDGSYNLGLAHGIPGIIQIVSETAAAGVERERALHLLENSLQWFMAQKRPDGSASWFASQIRPGERGHDTRPAWCYGDLGVVAVLRQVARRANRRDWTDFAARLLDHCLDAPDDSRSGIEDAGLCHGAAGNAHIFNRMYQNDGDPRCRDAALRWFDRALAMRGPGKEAGGFLALRTPGGQRTWEASPSFLDGAIGVALAFMAALTPVEPSWDRLLMLSGHPRFDSGPQWHLDQAVTKSTETVRSHVDKPRT